ncbi:MAG TPA: hypothetical protein PLT95_09825, partial [Agitococcus sp.]|nr:hypothetical protein [Agitococcus sp.]
MLRLTELRLPIDHQPEAIKTAIAKKLAISEADIQHIHIHKRSYDARKVSQIVLIYIVDIDVNNEAKLLAKFKNDPHVQASPDMAYKFVAQAPNMLTERPIIVGFGPCGILAALVLAQMGFKPIVLERGKEVRQRTKDTWGLWRKHILNPESNVQFGEGGAGTFSDGKLYSQIKDPR